MRLNLGPKTIMYPMPVLVIGSYDENGKANAMCAAWGAICDYDEIFVSVYHKHKSSENILKNKAFTVSITDISNVTQADYVGIVSANKNADKLQCSGWHNVKSEFVNAPIFEELPMTLECEVLSYDTDNDRLFGKIVNISVDDRIIGSDGKIDPEILCPVIFDPVHHTYRKLGDVVGKAFSDGKKLFGESDK